MMTFRKLVACTFAFIRLSGWPTFFPIKKQACHKYGGMNAPARARRRDMNYPSASAHRSPDMYDTSVRGRDRSGALASRHFTASSCRHGFQISYARTHYCST